jgi:hypothetical protein
MKDPFGGAKVDHTRILFKLHYHPQDPPSTELQWAWREELSIPPLPPSGTALALIPSGHTHLPIWIVDRLTVPNMGNLLSIREFAFKDGSLVSSYLPD